MAGKMSKTNVAARRANRDASSKKTCPYCGQEQELALVVLGRGKTEVVRLCCEKAGVTPELQPGK